MKPSFFRSPIFLLYVGGAFILVIAFGFWWTKVYQSPYNVYWGMLQNNLSTAGVSKHITQSNNGTNLDQILVSTFGAQNAVHARTTLTTTRNTVQTESISTPDKDSVRYTAITTAQKTKAGKPFDFSSILGKWASNKLTNSSSASAASGLFTQTAIGVMGGNLLPQANLTSGHRKDLLKRLHSEVIFDTSYTDVKKTRQHGRPIYTYTLNIQPVAYVGFEKAFAKYLGIKALDDLDPNQYQGEAAIKVTVSVDAWSHQLAAVDFPNQNHHEVYENYGASVPVGDPQATITGAQLQRLLGKIQ
jgi:hypothetical protein